MKKLGGKMRIFEFIDKYCKDLVDEQKVSTDLFDLKEFSHDAIIQDESGAEIPVVNVDNVQIPVADFISLDKSDFVQAWKTPGAGEAYDNYIEKLNIFEGREVVEKIRLQMQRSLDRLNNAGSTKLTLTEV